MKIESIKNGRFVVSFYANLKYEFIEIGSNSRHDIIAWFRFRRDEYVIQYIHTAANLHLYFVNCNWIIINTYTYIISIIFVYSPSMFRSINNPMSRNRLIQIEGKKPCQSRLNIHIQIYVTERREINWDNNMWDKREDENVKYQKYMICLLELYCQCVSSYKDRRNEAVCCCCKIDNPTQIKNGNVRGITICWTSINMLVRILTFCSPI